MSGQPNEWDRFFIFYVISTLTSLVAQSLGLLIGAAAPQLEVSFILLVIYFFFETKSFQNYQTSYLGCNVYGTSCMCTTFVICWFLYQK